MKEDWEDTPVLAAPGRGMDEIAAIVLRHQYILTDIRAGNVRPTLHALYRRQIMRLWEAWWDRVERACCFTLRPPSEREWRRSLLLAYEREQAGDLEGAWFWWMRARRLPR